MTLSLAIISFINPYADIFKSRDEKHQIELNLLPTENLNREDDALSKKTREKYY